MKKITFIVLACFAFSGLKGQTYKTQNLIVVTLDGFRWEELYRGSDSALVNSKFTRDKGDVKKLFAAATPQERRAKLLPFFWSILAQQGQLYGNRDLGNKDEVANIYKFSYPGYNEIFTGFPDVRINSNDSVANPNMSVLEYINKQKGYEGKVAVFASWSVFPWIFNIKRSGLPVNAAYNDFTAPDAGEHFKYLNSMQREVPNLLGDDVRLDFLTFEYAKAYLKQYQPKVMYISFGETDDFAHQGNYELYLKQAHATDGFLKQLWDYIQSNPKYKDKTTLLITCDHGRGDVPLEFWTDHGQKTPHSEQTWFAVIGPDTLPTGEVKTPTTTYHKQLAQTIAQLLGFDFKSNAGHEAGDAVASVTGSN
jgi:hypothetical protein